MFIPLLVAGSSHSWDHYSFAYLPSLGHRVKKAGERFQSFGWHGAATVATWIMTLFIQRAERRNTHAIHAKLDEMLRAEDEADSDLATLDRKEPEEIEKHTLRWKRCSRDVLPKINSNGTRVSVHWFAGVLQSLCSPFEQAFHLRACRVCARPAKWRA